jgi:hypothetical protein
MKCPVGGVTDARNGAKEAHDGGLEEQARPKFREQGVGRMSEFKQLTDEDIADAALQAELESDPEYQDHDDGWYIADSFGTRESLFRDAWQGRYWRKEATSTSNHSPTISRKARTLSILVRSLAGLRSCSRIPTLLPVKLG